MHNSAFLKKVDSFGLIGSVTCAIHCALTPLVLSLLLTTGAHKAIFEGWEHLDLICLLIAPCLASLSLKEGYCKHQSKMPALIFALGFLLLLLGYSLEKLFSLSLSLEKIWHPLLMTLGGLIVASAHFLNIKLLNKNANCLKVCSSKNCY